MRLLLRPGYILQFHPRLLLSSDKYTEGNVQIHYYVLRSHASLKISTNMPDREQLLRIVPACSLKNSQLAIVATENQAKAYSNEGSIDSCSKSVCEY